MLCGQNTEHGLGVRHLRPGVVLCDLGEHPDPPPGFGSSPVTLREAKPWMASFLVPVVYDGMKPDTDNA